MKNEGPYIVEWIAYHRAIGVDNFLIYTNGCEDGTDGDPRPVAGDGGDPASQQRRLEGQSRRSRRR